MAKKAEIRGTRLNRYLQAKAREEKGDKSEDSTRKPRPPLYKLTTVEQVKKWIPSIQREIDYCLRQLEGVESRNYKDHKLDEFKARVEALEQEHKRFVSKVRSLDPSHVDMPWKPRGYTRKRSRDTSAAASSAKQLCSPLVPEEEQISDFAAVSQQRTASHNTLSSSTQSTTISTPHPLSAPPTSILGLSYSSSSEDEK